MRRCGKNKKSSKKVVVVKDKQIKEKISEKNIKKVIEYLEKVEMAKIKDIVDNTNLDKNEVSKIIKELKEKGKIISPKRCYYSLKR